MFLTFLELTQAWQASGLFWGAGVVPLLPELTIFTKQLEGPFKGSSKNQADFAKHPFIFSHPNVEGASADRMCAYMVVDMVVAP